MDINPEDIRKMKLIERLTIGDIKDVLHRQGTVGDVNRVYGLLEKFSGAISEEYTNGEIISFALALLSAQMLMMYEEFEK